MSGVKAKKRKQPDERQKNDLLRVLKALAPNHFSIGTFETHVSNNFKNLKNKASISLSAVEGLKDLVIPPKALVNVAGGGVVLQCKNPTVEHSLFALKVTRYSLFATRNGDQIKQLQEETDKAKAEYVKQASLSHLNVARVLRMTTASIDSTALPLITAEWIDGALGLNESLLLYSKDPCYAGKEHVERHKVIISILIQCFEGLAHLHSRALIHWDIKSGNLLVDKFGIPRIIDLGNSHYTYESPEKVETSLWNLPPDLAKSNITHDDGDSQRVSIELGGNKWNTPYIDLYMLGRELNRLFLVDEALLQQDEEYQRKHTTRKLLDRAESQQFLENIFPKNDEDAVFCSTMHPSNHQ